jgi:purine-binding chemotaxis protein CheW
MSTHSSIGLGDTPAGRSSTPLGDGAGRAAGDDSATMHVDPAAPSRLQYLRFSLGEGTYAVSIEVVREILQAGAMTALPLAPAFMRGVMNLRGAVVPVVDLRARLGLRGAAIGRRSCVVVVEVPEVEDSAPQTLGMLVDAVHEVFDVAALEPAPAFGTPVDPAFVAGMARRDSEVLVVLNLAHVLAQDELARLMEAHVAREPAAAS